MFGSRLFGEVRKSAHKMLDISFSVVWYNETILYYFIGIGDVILKRQKRR